MSETIEFVNIHGDPVDTTRRVKIKRESIAPAEYHKGWRVVGVSPEAVALAAKDHANRISRGILESEFDPEKWIKNATLKPARTKPFEIESAAIECARLARSAGWHRVEVRRLAKGANLV